MKESYIRGKREGDIYREIKREGDRKIETQRDRETERDRGIERQREA